MANGKAIYRLIDGRGRVYLPKELRDAADLHSGDIVKLTLNRGALCVSRVRIIEAGDQSPEAVEAYVRAAMRTMDPETLLDLISDLADLLGQEKSQKGRKEETHESKG
ncbi:AbrB family transcriptional regulator [Clostridium sp. W14A]|nr:AbrB family transcriptional regulator [Clostridium sp. W14A]